MRTELHMHLISLAPKKKYAIVNKYGEIFARGKITKKKITSDNFAHLYDVAQHYGFDLNIYASQDILRHTEGIQRGKFTVNNKFITSLSGNNLTSMKKYCDSYRRKYSTKNVWSDHKHLYAHESPYGKEVMIPPYVKNPHKLVMSTDASLRKANNTIRCGITVLSSDGMGFSNRYEYNKNNGLAPDPERTAIWEALKYATTTTAKEVVLLTDSLSSINCIINGISKMENKTCEDLAKQGISVKLYHVRGHGKNLLNRAADRIANKSTRMQATNMDLSYQLTLGRNVVVQQSAVGNELVEARLIAHFRPQ